MMRGKMNYRNNLMSSVIQHKTVSNGSPRSTRQSTNSESKINALESRIAELERIVQTGKGPRGEKGPMGPRGLKGETGPRGVSGTVGNTGLSGTRGADGADGVKGADGGRGADGARGEKGVKGEKGSRGGGI